MLKMVWPCRFSFGTLQGSKARRLPAELGQHALVAAARGGDRKLKGMVLLTRVTGSATASASGTGVGQWPGIRRPGTV